MFVVVLMWLYNKKNPTLVVCFPCDHTRLSFIAGWGSQKKNSNPVDSAKLKGTPPDTAMPGSFGCDWLPGKIDLAANPDGLSIDPAGESNPV
jgi:hypothetical protein